MKYARFADFLLFKNWKPILLFEIFYKFLMLAGFTPLLRRLLNYSMYVAGVKYIGNDTLLQYLLNPLTLLILFGILLAVVYVTFFDMIAVITALDASWHDETITFSQMLRTGFAKSLGIFSFRNWKFSIYILLILPTTGFLGYGSYLSSLELPGFIADYARTKWFLAIGFLVLAVVLIFFSFKWAFSIHFYTLEDCDYKEAVARSGRLMKGRVPRTILYMIARYAVIILYGAIVTTICAVVAYLLLRFRMIYDADGTLIFSVIVWVVYFVLVAVSLVAVPIAYSLLSALYYGYEKEESAGVQKIPYKELVQPNRPYQAPKFLRKATVVFLIIGLCALAFWQFTFGALSNYDISSVKPAIVSHRGNSAEAPENSIPAFELAIEDGVQWIELDVHQTADDVVVVTHDSNISRITGIDKNVYDITYEELAGYDSGAWFSQEYAGLHVATLDEVLKMCKGKVHLQIELKPTGHEKNFEQNVIDLVRENGFENECVLASMDAQCLKNCKELAPDLETLYIMVIAAGDIASIDYADGFSIEETFAFDSTIEMIHAENKNCYVWTVNDANKVRHLLENNVDGILTDDPKIITREMEAYYSNDPVRNVISWLKLTSFF